jgi:hypothetical protein
MRHEGDVSWRPVILSRRSAAKDPLRICDTGPLASSRLRLTALVLVFASAALAQTPVGRVAQDARVVDRVAEVSKRDLPKDLLKRMLDEDIDLLRGKRNDGTYQYATWERLEAGRNENSFSIQTSAEDKFTKSEVRGEFVYRVVLDMPSRRMIVTHNRPVWIDRVEIEYVPQSAPTTKTQVAKIGAWLQPGELKPIEIDDVARQATVRVFSRTDPKSGYGNLNVTLIKAKIFDNPDSPYADAVASAKAIERGLDHDDVSSIRAMAQRMAADLQPQVPTAHTVEVTAPKVDVAPASQAPVAPDIYAELQAIEDLITGSDAEKRQGLDRLHQLLRRLRPQR